MIIDNLKKLVNIGESLVQQCDIHRLQLLIDLNIKKFFDEPKFIELQAKLFLLQPQPGWSTMEQYAIKKSVAIGLRNIRHWDRKSKVPSLLIWWTPTHLGAALMRLVFLPKLLELSDLIGIVCDNRLHDILNRSFANVECFSHESINQKSDKFSNYYCIVDLISLPGIFLKKNDFAPILDLKPKVEKLNELNKFFPGHKKIRCGFSWFTTNPDLKKRVNRSIPEKIAENFLISISDINFFSLQHGIDPNDLNKPFNEEIIIYPINPEKDVEGLIALIHLMDIIITIDNSVVHISGAMGKPTILILSNLPEYKWGMKNSETSLHKSVTIIRNKNIDSWSDSLKNASLLLNNFAIQLYS